MFTKLSVHALVQAALRTTDALKPGSDTKLDAQMLEDIAADAPSITLRKSEVLQPLAGVLVAAGMQKSKGAARRMVQNGGVYMNNAKVAEQDAAVHEEDLIDGRLLLLAAGKKNKMVLRVTE